MKRSSLLSLCITLMLSCGYAVASPEPHGYVFSSDYGVHAFVGAGESVSAKVAREVALIEWQHAVAQESSATRSDMHASSGGLIFTAIQREPNTDGHASA